MIPSSIGTNTREPYLSKKLDHNAERWGAGPLDFWDDFDADGHLEKRPPVSPDSQATIASTFKLAPDERHHLTK